MTFDSNRTTWALVLLLGAVPAGIAQPQRDTGQKNPPLVISSMYGRDLFDFYCATCHGRDGKGHGPTAAALKVLPTDLTTIAQRNRGAFPAERLQAVITGDATLPTPAHGSKEMPVWGPIFRGLDPSDHVNEIRIANIVSYIESIQSKPKV